MISWSPPNINAERVISYSLFYKMGRDEQYKEVANVSSPYELMGLKTNVPTTVYLLSHTPEGSSLKSTRVEIVTQAEENQICQVGNPLLTSNGNLFLCYRDIDCPPYYVCSDDSPSDDIAGRCCPTGMSFYFSFDCFFSQNFYIAEDFVKEDFHPSTPDLAKCCADKGVTGKCLNLCSYNTTTQDLITYGSACFDSIKAWVDCGGGSYMFLPDSRDHRPCCSDAGVPSRCLDFCHSPLKDVSSGHLMCIKYATVIATCILHGVLKLPGPARNLNIAERGSNFVNLSWSAPSQPTTVDFYEVTLKDGASTVFKANTTELFHIFRPLEPGVEYKASLISYNQYGYSVPSSQLTFVLHSSDEDDYDRPSAPYGVIITWVGTSAVNVSWAWTGMTVNRKPCTNVKFSVFYRVENSTSIEKVETSKNYLVINNMLTAKLYNLYVVAVDLSRNVSSSPSEIDLEVENGKKLGDRVTISCFTLKYGPLNLTLEYGDEQVATVPPIVTTKTTPITVYSDFDVTIPCEIRAFPACTDSSVYWSFTPLGQPLADTVYADYRHSMIVDVDRPSYVPSSGAQASLIVSVLLLVVWDENDIQTGINTSVDEQ
ncbi:unnamed protein product [Soboliphyme baturini]|uniref:Fibronectin type-III domain-containing protein n=1 Tax=Soboliphyme baturini TaxID=241478 RepID=A0A183IYX1_9BILA|nr:unnamed protein product [Soboliphyme baturini]